MLECLRALFISTCSCSVASQATKRGSYISFLALNTTIYRHNASWPQQLLDARRQYSLMRNQWPSRNPVIRYQFQHHAYSVYNWPTLPTRQPKFQKSTGLASPGVWNMKHDPTWYSGYNDCNFNQLVGQMGLVCKFVITVVSNIVDMWVMEVPWSWGSFDTTVSRLWRDAR